MYNEERGQVEIFDMCHPALGDPTSRTLIPSSLNNCNNIVKREANYHKKYSRKSSEKSRNTEGQFLPSLYSSLLFFLLSFSFREKYKLLASLLKQYIFLFPQLETSLGMPLIRLVQKMSFGRRYSFLVHQNDIIAVMLASLFSCR